MSFYHVLPSNVAPGTYPDNSASAFMTPLTVPYNLEGKWQVALTSVNYRGCVNTFLDTDTVKVTRKLDAISDLKKVTRPIRIDLPKEANTLKKIANMITKKLPGVLKVEHYYSPKYGEFGADYFKWIGMSDEYLIVLCKKLAGLFALWTSTISSYDDTPFNYSPFRKSEMLTTPLTAEELTDLYLTIVRIPHDARKIIIKKANEEVTPQELVQRVNSRVPNVTLKLAPTQKHFILEKVCPKHRPDCHGEMILMSKDFHKCSGFQRAAMYDGHLTRFKEFNFDKQFSNEWSITVFNVNESFKLHDDDYEWIHPLKSISFQEHASALKYLNTLNSDIEFKLSKENKLSLELKREDMKVSFNSDLRDCLAFDKNDVLGIGTHLASGAFSLKRRISYLYIYSNVGEYCKVGDTQAPLLGIVPFEGKACETLQERIFQNPMYVPLRANHMSFIAVQLCDGTGQTVPFTSDAESVLCLHFKQV